MAPTTIGSRFCSYVESALRGLKLSFKSETEFRTFVDKHKNTFTAYKNLPNEHYYNLLEAFRNGVSYNPDQLTYGCPFCSVEAANIPEALVKISSEGHQKYCSKVRETRVDIKQHKDGVVSTTTIKNEKEVGTNITDDCQNPANMIRIGDFIINTDMDAKAQGLPRIIEPTMTGDRHLLTGVITLKELTPEPKPVAEKKKKHRKTLSQDRKEWVMKWPAADSEVTKDTFKHHFVEVQNDFGFIDLLADERDEVSREETVTNTTRTWFGLRKSVTKVTPKITVKTKVNDLIKQTLLIASELNLPIEYIDNRKHILKKRGRFYRVPLVHCYNPDVAMEDDIQDPILREILSSKYMSEQVKNFNPFLLSSKLVKPGWSGVLVHRDNVLDQNKFEWNKHGLCVIQGIGVNNYILSALEKHDDCDIMEFYSGPPANLDWIASYNRPLKLDHEVERTEEGVLTMLGFARAFWPNRHIGCAKCWRNVPDLAASLTMTPHVLQAETALRRLNHPVPTHFANMLRHIFRTTATNRGFMELLGGYDDPRLQGILNILGDHMQILVSVQNNLRSLESELHSHPQQHVIQDCRNQIESGIVTRQERLKNEIEGLGAHLRQLDLNIDRVTDLTDGIPRLNLDVLRNADGNPTHHENRDAVHTILRIPGVSTRIPRRELATQLSNWEMLGPVSKRFWTSCVIIGQNGHADLTRFMRSCSKLNQHTDHCTITFDGIPRIGCKKHASKFYTSLSVMPMVDAIRYGDLTHSKTIPFNLSGPLNFTAINNGYCYVNCFLAMIQFIPEKLIDQFTKRVVPTTILTLGPWPTMRDLTQAIFLICIKFPTVCEAPVPILLVDHTRSLMHFIGQFGVGDYGFHQFNLATFQDWYDIASYVYTSPLADYQVGGLIRDITRALKSKDEFKDFLMNRPDDLIEGLLHPSSVHTLFIANQKYQLIEKFLDEEDNIASLLARINTLGRKYNLFAEADEVIRTFMMENMSFATPLHECFGQNVSDLFTLRMNNLIQAQIDLHQVDRLERVVSKKMDFRQEECDMRESMLACLRDSLSWYEFYSIKYRFWRDQHRSNIDMSWPSSKVSSIKACAQNVLQKVCSYSHERYDNIRNKVSFWMIIQTFKGLVPYYAMITMLIFVAGMSLKLIKYVKALTRGKDSETVEFQSKRSAGKVTSQFMAIAAIVTALFNSDLSDQWYSSMIKFKSIMSTLFDEYVVFEADDTEQIDLDPMKFIEFALSESAPPSSSARLNTFGEWRQAKEQINTLGILPRDQGVFMKMDKKSISAIANKIFDSQNTEFLVVGKVGCGKSTKFVHALMQTGKVLLCEPTRALVTNVEEGINKVCGVDPSVRMRFYNKFGSHPVTIMTYGFALNWFANGCENVTDYQYIVMDECHKVESDFIVFYNWLRVRAPQIKVIKLSATPVNHITAYEPECSVNVIEQASCSIKAFAEAQGRNSAMDATKYGRIILVFVASYNDVDTATEVLRHKGYGVVKADRRQLRNTPNLSDKISEMQQQFVFVVATNAIENGVTLDVDVVVDFGEKIVGTLDSAYRHIGTRRVKISAGERIQRLGRVGRFKPGTAIRMGLLDKASDAIDELTATEAALKSFVFNVPPCLINVDTELIDQITRPQATTASMFELDLVYFSHFIRQDGKIPKAIYQEFRHLMLRDTKLEIIDKYSTSVASRGWKTVGFYSVSGHTRLDEHHNTFIPFHSHIISDEALSRIAQAMKESDPGRGRGFALPADQLYQAVYKISYEQDKIGSILNVIEGLRQREQEKLDSLRTSTSILTSQSLLNILNCRFLANKEKLEQQYLTSLTTLNNVEQTLRSIPSGSNDETILEYLRENPMTAQCVLFEGAISEQIDEQILLKKKFVLGKVIVPCLLGLIAMCGIYAYYRLRKHYEVVEFEAKGKKASALRYKRDKRGTMSFYHNHDSEFADDFGSAYDTRSKKGKSRGTVNPLGQKSHAFTTFYDFDINAFDIVKFVDPNSGVMIERNTYGLDMEELVRDFEEANLELEPEVRWADAVPEELHAYFIKDGVKDGYFTKLTPHNSKRVSKKNTCLPVGFPERHGEFRQDGPITRVSAEAIKAAGVPIEKESVDFEQRGVVDGPRSMEHFKSYVVRVDNGIGKLNGFGFGRYLCTNAHFFGADDKHERKKQLIVKSTFGEQDFGKAKDIKFQQIGNTDVAVFKVPFDAPQYRKKLLMRPPVAGEQVFMITPMPTHQGMQLKVSMQSIVIHDESYGSMWKHFISTVNGSCGSLLVAVNDHHVVGIHSLGVQEKRGWNYFAPVTTELIQCLNKTDNNFDQFTFRLDMVDCGTLCVQQESSIFPLMRLPKEILGFQMIHQGDKYCGSNIIKMAELQRPMNFKHVIKGCRQEYLNFLQSHNEHQWAITNLGNRLPSVLSVEAFYIDLLKYDEPTLVGAAMEKHTEIAFEAIIKYFTRAGFRQGEIEFEWDVNRVVADMNKDAAMGACYHGKKKDWFESLTEDELIAAHKESLFKMLQGKHGIWTGSLKAELRPELKVTQKKTRVFTAAPIDVLLGAKSLVDNFNHKFYETHLQGPWTVGINKFNQGWNRLANSFRHEWNFLDADGSRFDSSLSPFLFAIIVRVRKYFMEQDKLGFELLDSLYTQIVFTLISTVDGNIVRKHKGNNSGQPSTVVDNTIALMFVVEYARSVCSERFGKEMRFTFVANGDDLLINGPDDELRIIQENFSELFSHLGLNYKFEDKKNSITEVDYMSCQFMKKGDMYIPKLSKGRILSIMEWERNEDVAAQISALNAARIEAWGYDDVYKLADDFIKYFAEQRMLKEYFYIPESFIEALYMKPANYMNLLMGALNDTVYFQMATPRPVMEQVTGYEPAVQDEDAEAATRRQARNTERYQAALNSWERAEAERIQSERGRQGGGGGDDADVPQGATGPAFTLPPPPTRVVWVPPMLQRRVNAQAITRLMNYKPDVNLMRADVASQQTLDTWLQGLTRDLQLNNDQVDAIIQSFMVWCINSGTSHASMSQEFWQADDGAGNTAEYPLRPFIENAGTSLRSVMRNFSDIAETWVRERNRRGTWIGAWASRAGLTDKRYAHVGFDFWISKPTTTHDELHYHTLMTQAHLRGLPIQNLAMANLVRQDGATPDYHVGDDIRPGMHNAGGGRLN